jgi:putative oxidoreductase
MPAPTFVQRAARLGFKVTSALSFLAPLLTRLTLGYTFFLTGRGKLTNPVFFQNLVDMITERGIPFPVANAYFVASLEFFGGLLLVLGLLTRLTALALAGTMAVALKWKDFLSSWKPDFPQGPLDFDEWVILVFLAWLVLHGPGVVSVDTQVKKWLFDTPAAPAAPPARPKDAASRTG